MGIMVAEWFRRRGRVILLVLCIVAIFAAPAGARGPTIRDIQPYDTIFVYEEGLNLSALRNATTNNPITALHKYQNDRPYEGITKTIPVADDTNFDLLAVKTIRKWHFNVLRKKARIDSAIANFMHGRGQSNVGDDVYLEQIGFAIEEYPKVLPFIPDFN